LAFLSQVLKDDKLFTDSDSLSHRIYSTEFAILLIVDSLKCSRK